MNLSERKLSFIKFISTVLVILMSSSLFLHFFCMPYRNPVEHSHVVNCLTYLVELFGRGSYLVVQRGKYKGFGIYVEDYYLYKTELAKPEISGNTEGLAESYRYSKHIVECLQVEYFFDNIYIKQKEYCSEKRGKATFKYKQTGVKNLLVTNKMLSSSEPTMDILTKSTDYTQYDGFEFGSALFACKKELSIDEAVSYIKIWNNEPKRSDFLTTSFAIKTGEDDASPAIFLRTALTSNQPYYDSAEGCYIKVLNMLTYLGYHSDVVQKILDAGLFNDAEIDIQKIYQFIVVKGLRIIGYNSIDAGTSNKLYDSVIKREEDGISKLVQLNNGTKLFKN